MSQGLNLAQGRGYTDTDGTPITLRAPMFPLWLALFFRWFGASVPSAFVAARIFYVLNAILVYFLAARLYDRWAGFYASLLTLTSFSLSEWSVLVHLDHILPALILLYLLVLLWAFAGRGYWRFALAGLVLGVAYLLKEVAVLFLPLPFLLWVGVRAFRARRAAFGAGLIWLVFLITVAPWWVYVRRITNEFLPLGQETGPGVLKILLEAVTTQGLWYPRALVMYYTSILAPHFGLASLFILAWLVTLVLALRGWWPERVLSLGALCFLPILLFQGLEGWRARQSVIFFLLSYLVLVGVLWRGLQFIQERWRWRERIFQALSTVVCIGLLYGQLMSEDGRWWGYVQRYNVAGFLNRGWDGVKVQGWHQAQPVAQWLLQHAEFGTTVLSSPLQFRTAIYFFAQGQFPIYKMPLLDSPYYPTQICVSCEASHDQKEILFLWLLKTSPTRGVFRALAEEDLLAVIKRYGVRYVVVPPLSGFEALYFEQSPHFTEVARFEEGLLKIYKVERVSPAAFEMHVSSDTQKFLDILRRQAPSRYEALKKAYFQGELGLSPTEIRGLEAGQYPMVKPSYVYEFVLSGALGEYYQSLDVTADSEYIPGELIVGIAPQSAVDLVSLSTSVNAEAVDRSIEMDAYLLRFETDQLATAAMASLRAREGVRYVERNGIVRIPEVPQLAPKSGTQEVNISHDTIRTDRWVLDKIQYSLAAAPEANPPCVVVLDTGVDYAHPDLSGKVYLGYDAWEGDMDPMDVAGHGTHVARIAAAWTNEATGMAGVSPQSHILAVRVLGLGGWGTWWTVAQGINWVNNQTAASCGGQEPRVYNLGVEGEASRFLAAAVQGASRQGRLVVAAAGNGNTSEESYPAAEGNVLGVAATEENDHRTWFSNYYAESDPWVGIAAPGWGVLSTTDGSYRYFGGTSLATPVVAGVAARVWAKYPGLSLDQLCDTLQSTADPTRGFPRRMKRVNLYRALGGMSRTIQGRILDAANTTPLSGVMVEVKGEEGETICTTVTDEAGFYVCEGLPSEGIYRVRASQAGRPSISRNVDFKAGQQFNANLTMARNLGADTDNHWTVTIMWNGWQPFETVGHELDLWLYDPGADVCYGWSNSSGDDEGSWKVLMSGDSYGIGQTEAAWIKDQSSGTLQVWVTLWDSVTGYWPESARITDSGLVATIYKNNEVERRVAVPAEPKASTADNWYVGRIDLAPDSWQTVNQIKTDAQLPWCIKVP